MDAIVIGGGFYGCCIATFLRQSGYRVTLLEKGHCLLGRASLVNQARVHNGYHYPRSLLTALRSAYNFPRFVLDFRSCVCDSFRKVYAIARTQSKVNAYQFAATCRRVGVPAEEAAPAVRKLFSPDLVEAVFQVKEYAFDATELRRVMEERLTREGVVVKLESELLQLRRSGDGTEALLADGSRLHGDVVYNCTYSQINQVLVRSGAAPLSFKHEIAELAMVEPPEQVRGLGVTVMDGPFFSFMPFPPLGLHSLSHVRYTPHESWMEPEQVRDPYARLDQAEPEPRALHMLRDAQRYMPLLSQSRWVQSLFEVKTVLRENEADDGRPILMRSHPELGPVTTIMGGKIDNIYDVLAALEKMRERAVA
jgi:glycine/D-amino acid oxidase-like deaminating enzyme